MSREIDVLNDEIVAAGVRMFVAGLSSAGRSKSLRTQPDGALLAVDRLPTEPTPRHTEREAASDV